MMLLDTLEHYNELRKKRIILSKGINLTLQKIKK